MLKKKRIIIVAIVIALFAGLRLYLINKEKSKTPINAGYEHSQKVNDFVEKEQGAEPHNQIKTNEGGYTNVLIENKQALTKVITTEQMFIVSDKITESITYLNQILKDSELEKKGTDNYYSANIDIIKTDLGIDDAAAFTSFINKLSFVGDETIYKAIIDENFVSKTNNDVKFNLTLQTESEKKQVFNITFTLNEGNKEDNKMYWN